MKKYLVPFILLTACNAQPIKSVPALKSVVICQSSYLIDLSYHNYSLAYTIAYHVNNDSLNVKFLDGIKNGEDSVVFEKKLSESERLKLCIYMTAFNIDTLKQEYTDPCFEDGDIKYISLQVGDKHKITSTFNFYIQKLGDMYDTINTILPNNFKINYRKNYSTIPEGFEEFNAQKNE